VLWEDQHLQSDEMARFHTRSGLLTASRQPGIIWLDFPATPSHPVPLAAELARGIDASMRYVGRTAFDYLVELETEAAVRDLVPNLNALARLPVRGIIVTARSESGTYNFVSRFFAPAAGVPEDPVTGSAHCALAPFWAERLSRTELVAYQASQRGGIVRMQLEGPRVRLGGQAVTVLRGELLH
jgi:predicted PhzF superfamily epimerase YddE/YHI9